MTFSPKMIVLGKAGEIIEVDPRFKSVDELKREEKEHWEIAEQAAKIFNRDDIEHFFHPPAKRTELEVEVLLPSGAIHLKPTRCFVPDGCLVIESSRRILIRGRNQDSLDVLIDPQQREDDEC